jgi:hypothetical protein
MQLVPYQGTTYKGAQNVRILESWVSGLWIWNGQQYSGRGSCPEGLDNVNTFSVMLRQIIDNDSSFCTFLGQPSYFVERDCGSHMRLNALVLSIKGHT